VDLIWAYTFQRNYTKFIFYELGRTRNLVEKEIKTLLAFIKTAQKALPRNWPESLKISI